jgi:hypothetical protein
MSDTGFTGQIGNYITAVSGLGTAAFGLVDATKVFNGGISIVGFPSIRAAVLRLIGTAGGGGAACFGRVDMLDTLRANWINGVDIAQQKTAAKALIRLYLSPATAPQLAQATGLPATAAAPPAATGATAAAAQPAPGLVDVANHIQAGVALSQEELNLLGRFDALVSATLDEGYERADQLYRNAAKILAGGFAIVLGMLGAVALHQEVWQGVLVGIIAVPLAPVAKDLSSALQAAVKALTR